MLMKKRHDNSPSNRQTHSPSSVGSEATDVAFRDFDTPTATPYSAQLVCRLMRISPIKDGRWKSGSLLDVELLWEDHTSESFEESGCIG